LEYKAALAHISERDGGGSDSFAGGGGDVSPFDRGAITDDGSVFRP